MRVAPPRIRPRTSCRAASRRWSTRIFSEIRYRPAMPAPCRRNFRCVFQTRRNASTLMSSSAIRNRCREVGSRMSAPIETSGEAPRNMYRPRSSRPWEPEFLAPIHFGPSPGGPNHACFMPTDQPARPEPDETRGYPESEMGCPRVLKALLERLQMLIHTPLRVEFAQAPAGMDCAASTVG